MRNVAMARLLLILVVVGATPYARGQKRDMDRVIDQADAIVVGELQSGQQSGYAVTFVLSVVRALKGELSTGAVVSVSAASALRSDRTLKGNYGLWFLRKSAGWTLLSVVHGQYPFELAYFSLPEGGNPAPLRVGSPRVNNPRVNDLVAAELTGALLAYTDRA